MGYSHPKVMLPPYMDMDTETLAIEYAKILKTIHTNQLRENMKTFVTSICVVLATKNIIKPDTVNFILSFVDMINFEEFIPQK